MHYKENDVSLAALFLNVFTLSLFEFPLIFLAFFSFLLLFLSSFPYIIPFTYYMYVPSFVYVFIFSSVFVACLQQSHMPFFNY